MTVSPDLQRGATIPGAGSDVVVALCLPDTWTRIVSGLLIPPTQKWFWDSTANDEDRETATRIAHTILAKFLTADCKCGLYEPGTLHSDLIDFTAGQLEGWSIIKGSLEADGIAGEVIQYGNFFSPQLEIVYNFPDPALFQSVWTLGASRMTFAGTSQTFPYYYIGAFLNGTSLWTAYTQAQLGFQSGSSPLRVRLDSNSSQLTASLTLFYDAGAFADIDEANACEILIEQLQLDWYEPI